MDCYSQTAKGGGVSLVFGVLFPHARWVEVRATARIRVETPGPDQVWSLVARVNRVTELLATGSLATRTGVVLLSHVKRESDREWEPPSISGDRLPWD